jgi:hypothetical protein
MQLSWGRGFFRIWAVLAIVWVMFFGWREYSVHSWWTDPVVRIGGECWDRFAKWQDGQRFGEWDAFDDVALNEAPSESINERNRWRELIRQKLRTCEDTKPAVERFGGWVADNLSSLKDALLLILLPPFGLLLFGYCIGWVAKGFRASP